MEDQLSNLLEWFQEADYDRAFHFLAVFAKDRGSPQTDWPVNENMYCPELIKLIIEARKNGIMTPVLFSASLSALAQMDANSNLMLNQDTVNFVVNTLQEAKTETESVFTLKLLTLMALHQPKSGIIEKMLIKNKKIIPTLLTILQDDSKNVFEAKYPSELLSVMLRVDPSCISEMHGKYLDSEGNELSIFTCIREGIRFKDGFSVPYYVRLARDLFIIDEDLAVKGFMKSDFMSVIIGQLRNNFSYTEVVQPLVRMQRMIVEKMDNPADILAYSDFLTIVTTVVEKSGIYQPTITDDIEEIMSLIMHDVNIPFDYVLSKRAMLQRYHQAVTKVRMTPKLRDNDHWIASDQRMMREARVVAA